MAEIITLSGAPEGYDAALLAREAARGPVIHIARDDRRAEAMREGLRFFAPELPVLEFPAWDTTPYDRVSPAAEVMAARMSTLAALAHQAVPGSFVLLTTLNAAIQRVPPRAVLQSASFTARTGHRMDEAGLRAWLARMGFSQAPTVTEPGDYAIRGGIIDIWPPGPAGPIRLDLFGDLLESTRRFDPVTQRSKGALDRLELVPISEVILDDDA
ncbi:MAG: transcription-repair coupling factor, partial [Paracoccus sp. (in: a-proteobacteria)]|nr:transcription-repair coupling factor [Paracoccus sp. (in: a-proteobacteria)]